MTAKAKANLIWILCAILGLSKVSAIEDVDPSTFQSLAQRDDVILLDVRTPQEIAEGKIAGASELNIYDEDFDRKISLLQKDQTILVYCRSGARSSEAANKLSSIGQDKIFNLEGGIIAWKAHKLELEIPKDRPIAAKQAPLDLNEFNNKLNDNRPTLLDFHTEWCSPCKKMSPIIDKLEAANTESLQIIRIDLDANPKLATQYGVSAVPTYIILEKGKEIWRHSGSTSQATIESKF